MGARMIKIFNKYLIKRSFYFSLSILLIFGLLDSIFILISELEKNSLDLYSSYKSIYLQDRNNKIKNSTEDQDDWGNLDN